MNYLLFLILLSLSYANLIINPLKYKPSFIHWINSYNMVFNTPDHVDNTYKKWLINDEYINYINNKNLSYTLAHNEFSGLSNNEFNEYYNIKPISKSKYKSNFKSNLHSIVLESNNSLPISFDWRDFNAISPVKNQLSCGSCWAFSTTGSLEAVYYIKYNKSVNFSEQMLVDCDIYSNGCKGGSYINGFNYIKFNNGLCSENDYSYTGNIQKCNIKCNNIINSTISNIYQVPSNSDFQMMSNLINQPISVAIEASGMSFQFYKSGIFTGQCGTKLDHAVLLVGYGDNYYTIKNSWGSSWGENGYIRLGKGNYNNGKGQCGVLMAGAFIKL